MQAIEVMDGLHEKLSGLRKEVTAQANGVRLLVGGNRPQNLEYVRVPNAAFNRTIFVDPATILHKSKVRAVGHKRSLLFHGGEWDKKLVPIEEVAARDVRYLSCAEIVVARIPVEETAEYRFLLDRAEGSRGRGGMGSRDQVTRYMNRIVSMYEQVQREGKLRTMQELGLGRHWGEIGCTIGRDGRLFKADDGNHRFAIARLLGIAAPVQINAIHADLIPALQKGTASGAIEALGALFSDIQERHKASNSPAHSTTTANHRLC